jgi:hypothetical protein
LFRVKLTSGSFKIKYNGRTVIFYRRFWKFCVWAIAANLTFQEKESFKINSSGLLEIGKVV